MTGNPAAFVAPQKYKLGHKGQLLFWPDATQRHVWPFMIVGPEPSRCILAQLVNRPEQVLIEPIVSDRLVVAVNHLEQAVRSAALKAVMHEVHRPGLFHRGRNRQRLRRFPSDAFLRLDPQVQLQFPVHPVDPPVIPQETP